MATYKIGLDAGQGNTKVAMRQTGPRGGKGEVLTVVFPSFVGSGDADRVQVMHEAAGLSHTAEVIRYDGGVVFVGDMARTHGRDATTGAGDADRYHQGHTTFLLWAAIGKLVQQQVLPARCTLRLVTGLPVAWYNPERKAAVQAALFGVHSFEYNGVQIVATVDGVGVLPEGPVILHQTAAKPVHQGVIDIGYGTTDLWWGVGSTPQTTLCNGSELAVGRIASEVQRRIDLLENRRPLRPDEMDAVLRAYVTGQPLPSLVSRGKALDLQPIVADAHQRVAGQLMGWIRQQWADEDRIGVASAAEVVRVSGGGARFFFDAIKQMIPQAVMLPSPEYDNVRAYHAIAETLSDDKWAAQRPSRG